jgi:hypothetical protein
MKTPEVIPNSMMGRPGHRFACTSEHDASSEDPCERRCRVTSEGQPTWVHPDGSVFHSASGPAGCFECANMRRKP